MATQEVAQSVPLLDPPFNPVLGDEPPLPGAIPVSYRGRVCYWMHPVTLNPILEESRELTEEEMIARSHEWADASDTVAKCYFIGGEEGPVKIGYSVDVRGRLRDLQAASPIVLNVLAIASGGAQRECAYHWQFAAHRLHGEWFRRCPEIEAEIERLKA